LRCDLYVALRISIGEKEAKMDLLRPSLIATIHGNDAQMHVSVVSRDVRAKGQIQPHLPYV
ncbi:MAG: hypothetical protein WC655_12115, partial [Candidatus Hydrogenedentales bacterium]